MSIWVYLLSALLPWMVGQRGSWNAWVKMHALPWFLVSWCSRGDTCLGGCPLSRSSIWSFVTGLTCEDLLLLSPYALHAILHSTPYLNLPCGLCVLLADPSICGCLTISRDCFLPIFLAIIHTLWPVQVGRLKEMGGPSAFPQLQDGAPCESIFPIRHKSLLSSTFPMWSGMINTGCVASHFIASLTHCFQRAGPGLIDLSQGTSVTSSTLLPPLSSLLCHVTVSHSQGAGQQ